MKRILTHSVVTPPTPHAQGSKVLKKALEGTAWKCLRENPFSTLYSTIQQGPEKQQRTFASLSNLRQASQASRHSSVGQEFCLPGLQGQTAQRAEQSSRGLVRNKLGNEESSWEPLSQAMGPDGQQTRGWRMGEVSKVHRESAIWLKHV